MRVLVDVGVGVISACRGLDFVIAAAPKAEAVRHDG